jgi:hypothetical protein
MTRQGRAFLTAGAILIVIEIAMTFVLQPAQWVSADVVGVYTIGDVPFATAILGLVALFAAGALLISAARRVGSETLDFHRRHRHPVLSQWAVYTGMAATASGIILTFGFCSLFLVAGYGAYDFVPEAPALGNGPETTAANISTGLVLLVVSGLSAIGWLVARAIAQRTPTAA